MTAFLQEASSGAWLDRLTRAKTDTEQEVATAPEGVVRLSFDVVYREHRTRLMSIVRGVIGQSDELEDVLQLVFIEIHRCLPKFEGRSRLTTWLYRIAVNVALQHIRRSRRKRWLVLGPTGDEEQRQVSPRDEIGVAEDRELLARVNESVAQLSDKKRVVWQLHELQGLEPQEIAEILDIPLNTVRSRLLSARHELMEDLERRQIATARSKS